MSYYKKKRIQLVVSILISLLFLIVPITAYLYVTTAEQYAYDLVCNCSGISELDSYVTYNMLSSDLKKYIKKGDLNFSSVENIVELAKKIDSINYDYETSNKYIRSSGSFKQNPLSQYFDYNNKRYAIEFDIYFKPKLFSIKPKIVDWNVLMYEVNINWKTILRDEVRLGNDQHCVKIEIISDKVIEYREESECISSAEFAEEILKPVGITVKKENVVCRERYITVSAEISTEQLAEICAMESVVDVLGKVGEPYPT